MKRHNEWGCRSDSLSIRHWRDIENDKCSLKAAIPSLCYLVYQFVPAHPRRNNSKHFNTLLQLVKKIQTKTKQNDNPDIEHANYNEKSAQSFG